MEDIFIMGMSSDYSRIYKEAGKEIEKEIKKEQEKKIVSLEKISREGLIEIIQYLSSEVGRLVEENAKLKCEKDVEFISINSYDMVCHAYDKLFGDYVNLFCECGKLKETMKELHENNKGKNDLISFLAIDNQTLISDNARLKELFKTGESKPNEKYSGTK